MRIGIIGLQGDVSEHVELVRLASKKLGVDCETVLVKNPRVVDEIDGLIIPGGESTVIGRLMEKAGLLNVISVKIARDGLPVLGTCAGCILLAKRIRDYNLGETRQPSLGVMSIEVVRNAFGRQRESFETRIKINKTGESVHCVFIRAPVIVRVWGDARILSTVNHNELGEVCVLAEEKNMIASCFHTEITGDTTLHEALIKKVLEERS